MSKYYHQINVFYRITKGKYSLPYTMTRDLRMLLGGEGDINQQEYRDHVRPLFSITRFWNETPSCVVQDAVSRRYGMPHRYP